MTTTTAPDKSTGRPFTISRTFDAPREPMWQAWIERERFGQWFGPKGFTVHWLPLKPTAEERQTFDSAPDGMKQGSGGTFEQLADYLAKT